MADKKFSDLTLQSLISTTKILAEDNTITDKFVKISGQKIIDYISSLNYLTETEINALTNLKMSKYERWGGELEIPIAKNIGLKTDLKIKDDSNSYNLELPAGFKKVVVYPFSEGSTYGGVDIGGIENNRIYDIYIIAKDGGVDADMLFVLEGNTPSMPSGYTLKVFFAKYKSGYNYSSSERIEKIYQSYDFFGLTEKNVFYKDYLEGFEISKISATILEFSEGECRDFSNVKNIWQPSIVQKSTSTFTEGENNGMFEASIVTETLYYLYIILGQNGRLDYIASTNAPSSFSTPTNFTIFQLIGFLKTGKVITNFAIWTIKEKWADENFDSSAGIKNNATYSFMPNFEDIFGTGVYMSIFTSNNSQDHYVSAKEEISHGIRPDSPLEFHLHLIPENTNSGDVVLFCEYGIIKNGDAIPTSGSITRLTKTVSMNGEQQMPTFDLIFPSFDLKPGMQVYYNMGRLSTDSNDTYLGKIAVLTMGYHFILKKLGSDKIHSNL